MGRMILCAIAGIWLAGCATHPGKDGDPILGRWQGVGMGAGFDVLFEKDHTYKAFDDSEPGSFDGSVVKGSWTRLGSNYLMSENEPSGEENKRSAQLNENGQLVVTAIFPDADSKEETPEIKVYLEKVGSKPKATAKIEPPAGEWRYAYTSKSSIPAASPAPFDGVTFQEDGKVHLKLTTAGREFDQTCKVSGNAISISTGNESVPKMDFSYRWEDEGETLMLMLPQSPQGPYEMEWVFLKPEKFLTEGPQGRWGFEDKQQGFQTEVVFGDDGLFGRTVKDKAGKVVKAVNEKSPDYYRLWPAPFGNAVTIVTFNPSIGSAASQIFKFEKTPEGLEMTPVELQQDGTLKVHDELKGIWRSK